jgi:Tfp pilus assembly protein PilX
LLKEAGLSYQKPRPTAAESDVEEQETFREELKKKRREMDATVVCIDQTKKSVQVEARAAIESTNDTILAWAHQMIEKYRNESKRLDSTAFSAD